MVRLDLVVADVLAGFGFEAEVELRLPPMEAPIDPIWMEALLVEIIDSRLAVGADNLGVGVRLGPDTVEMTIWDDARPEPLPGVVDLLAAKLGARLAGPRPHGDRTATLALVPF